MGMRWIALTGLVLLLAGCSTSGGGAKLATKDTTAPVVSGFTIDPPRGGWHAGTCALSLQATDDTGVTSVTARISGPNADAAPVALSLTSGHTYTGTLTVPANVNSDGSDNTYLVTAWAMDAAGNTTPVDQSLAFTVPAPDGPPVAPTAW